LIFYRDKKNSIKNHKRIPEKTLHLLELAGGVFAILILIYSIRHKNQKKSYFFWTYMILIFWIIFLYLFAIAFG
jgi:uncharacterized membrane protein YsdA (DUF1294 family)